MDTLILYAATIILCIVSVIKDKEKTRKAAAKAVRALEHILPQFLAVLILVAVALAFFDAETISRFLGDSSGFLGVVIAAVVGSVTLIPGFVAFPAASELLKNGAGLMQIAAFITSLMMVGIVTLPMEIAFFGRRVAFTRNLLAFLFVFAAAAFVSWAVML